MENAGSTGEELIHLLNKIKDRFPDVINEVRGRGLMIGVEINTSINKIAGRVFATRCVEKGLYVGYFGVNAEVVRIEPPLFIQHAENEIISGIVGEVAEEMKNGIIPEITYENISKYSIGI